MPRDLRYPGQPGDSARAPEFARDDGPDIAAKIARLGRRGVLTVLLGGVAFFAAMGSWYEVQQNEVGAVTRMGELVSDGPVPPGPHLKLPFLDTAHTIRISMEKIPVPAVKAKTVDNQFVTIDTNLSFHTGDPLRSLFKVGDIGAGGVEDKIIPFVQSRILDEMGKINALEVSDKKTVIEANVSYAIILLFCINGECEARPTYPRYPTQAVCNTKADELTPMIRGVAIVAECRKMTR